MTNPISNPGLTVNIEETVAPSKERIARSLKVANSRAAGRNESELKDACREMESLFIQHLMKEMRATIHKTGFISGGRAEEIYTSMLDAEVAAKISTHGGIGLADILMQQLGKASLKDGVEKSEGP